ncbi:DUF2255 family protein [soil metagenome]
MSTFTPAELDAVGAAEELQIASVRDDGTLRPFVTIWAVRAGDDIYVRSAHGRNNGWFRRALASGTGRVRAGGVEKDVTFELVPGGDIQDAIDAAYHSKYDRYGAAFVNPVVGEPAHEATLRVN